MRLDQNLTAERALVHAIIDDKKVRDGEWASRLKPYDFKDEACRVMFAHPYVVEAWDILPHEDIISIITEPYEKENTETYARMVLMFSAYKPETN